jgi:hypothetical protein
VTAGLNPVAGNAARKMATVYNEGAGQLFISAQGQLALPSAGDLWLPYRAEISTSATTRQPPSRPSLPPQARLVDESLGGEDASFYAITHQVEEVVHIY